MGDRGPVVVWELGKMAQYRILDLISMLVLPERCATVPLSRYCEYLSILDRDSEFQCWELCKRENLSIGDQMPMATISVRCR